MLFQTRILISGIVQGVGFRPFCVRLANAENISGYALNTSHGVEMELHGEEENLDSFLFRIVRENPPASFISSVKILDEKRQSLSPPDRFKILESRKEKLQTALIPADLAVCAQCLAEMKDPENRRYRYPFINCTDCGPRYTIIRELPYDRPKTTMSSFVMCPECSNEYRDSAHRRFHAEPNACPLCGPEVWLTDSNGKDVSKGDEAVRLCSSLLDQGKIVAIKGIGGFHIACTPFSDETVALLRDRKRRAHKPFALMVSSLVIAEELAYVPAVAKRLMASPASPVVLCCVRSKPRSSDVAAVSPLVAPGQRTLGLMLPYTPLHHLLLEGKSALIMTSANFSDAPIVSDNTAALASLSSIADFFLFSNRDIEMPIDDSVAMPLGRSFFLLRRGRGYTPLPMHFRRGDSRVIFGAGAEMKGSFCFSRDDVLLPGQYLGDMKQRDTVKYYYRALEHFMKLYELKPEKVAYDMHPQYLSTQIAKKVAKDYSAETVPVQHHHAHFAACLFENGVEETSAGILFDGTGYGEDGTIWGGEIFIGDRSCYDRIGHFYPSRLPGGDAAVVEPWRYALGLLHDVYGKEEAAALGERLWNAHARKVRMVLDILPFSPETTSCGRFFDAAAALLGCGDVVTFDGQAAMGLEAMAKGMLLAPFLVTRRENRFIIDWRPVIRWILDSTPILPAAEIAGGVHSGLARAVAEICGALREERGIRFAALSGGVWQNRRLAAITSLFIRRQGVEPLLHKLLPPNDECVSAGQTVVAAERFHQEKK